LHRRLDFLVEVQGNDAWPKIPVVLLADDGQTTELPAAHGLRVSLSVARPEGKRAFKKLVRSLRDLCETVVEMPRA
jgi:hypothetical protein